MSDDLIKMLKTQAQTFRNDASVYSQWIKTQELYCKPGDAYMQNLVSHRDQFIQGQNHAAFKQSNDNCLGCSQVLTCRSKCDKLE